MEKKVETKQAANYTGLNIDGVTASYLLNIIKLMKKFRKKPVVIEAIQLTKENIKEVYELVNNELVDLASSMYVNKWAEYCDIVERDGLTIPTLEDGNDKRAKHVATIGDFIIKGIHGEFYPCKPDIFEATYDAVL